MPTLARQASRRYRRPTTRTTRRRSTYRKGKSWFGTKKSLPEMKRQHYEITDQSITSSVYTEYFAGNSISQGLNDNDRIGSRITGKFITSKLLFDNQSDSKAQLVRWVVWSPRSATNTLGMDGTSFINNKLFRVWKQGYLSINHDSARVLSINIPLRNKVFDYSGSAVTAPIEEDKIYISLCCVTSGMTVKLSTNTAFYYVDN